MATSGKDARAAREAKLDALHVRLTGAVEQLVSGEDWARAVAFAARFRARSFANTILIFTQHQEAHGLGLAPVTGRFASATPQDAESWRRLGKGEMPRAGETVRTKMVGVRPAYVWDASQTTGDPIPEPPAPRLLEGHAPVGMWEGLAAQVQSAGFELRLVADASEIFGANGLTDYGSRMVSVRADMNPAAQVKTLAHELGHVLLHGTDAGEARQHRGNGEVEAESVALMVGAAHGMDTSGYTVPYVSTWAARVEGQDPVEVVKSTGERLRKTALGIWEQLDTTQVGNGTPPGLERDTPTRESTTGQAPAAPAVSEPVGRVVPGREAVAL